MKLFRVLCVGVAMALSMGMSVQADEPKVGDPKVGDEAPNFELKGSDGKTYKLSDFKGKQAVVVAWFPKAFTGGCTKECKSLKASGNLVKAFNVAYFTASCDEQDGEKGNTAFAKSLELDYPILSDPTRGTALKYGLVSDAKGNAKRVTFIIGKDGKIAHIEKMVKTEEHASQVADKLKELGVEAAPKK